MWILLKQEPKFTCWIGVGRLRCREVDRRPFNILPARNFYNCTVPLDNSPFQLFLF